MAIRVQFGRRTLPIGVTTLAQAEAVVQRAEAAANNAAEDAFLAAQPAIEQAVQNAAAQAAPQAAGQVSQSLRDAVAADRAAMLLLTQRAEAAAATAIVNPLQFVLQVAAALPARPVSNGPVTWITWTNPGAAMGPLDTWRPLPAPTIPDVVTGWTFEDRLDGVNALLTIPAPGAANPPVTAVEYQIDGGAPITYSGTPVAITGTTGVAQSARVRYVNFVGPGPWTQPQTVQFRNGFFDDFNRANGRLTPSSNWTEANTIANGRAVLIDGNRVRGEGANDTYIVILNAPLPDNQYAEAQITANGATTASPRGVSLILRRQAGTTDLYRARLIRTSLTITAGATTLYSGNLAALPTWPALCRFQVVGNVLTFLVNGTAVATVSDPANTYSSGQAGFGLNSPTSDLGQNWVDDFRAGRAT